MVDVNRKNWLPTGGSSVLVNVTHNHTAQLWYSLLLLKEVSQWLIDKDNCIFLPPLPENQVLLCGTGLALRGILSNSSLNLGPSNINFSGCALNGLFSSMYCWNISASVSGAVGVGGSLGGLRHEKLTPRDAKQSLEHITSILMECSKARHCLTLPSEVSIASPC